MKKTMLTIAGLLCIQFIMAQWSSDPSFSKRMISGSPDDSFVLSPDTLWFVTGIDFSEGKQFRIINPHSYSLDIQHIDNFGTPCANCIPWYTTPSYPVSPVNIPANDSITTLVRFVAIDRSGSPFVYDTLNVSTAGHSEHIIMVVDSVMAMIGLAERGIGNIVASPNPFTDRIKISLGLTRETIANVMIYNALMQPVRELFTGNISKFSKSLTWDGTDRYGANLSRGIYFITLRTVSGQKTLKVVKL